MIDATGQPTPPADEPRKLIGVTPASAAENRRVLFRALEEAFPVRFEARDQTTDLSGLDGLLVLVPANPEKLSAAQGDVSDACPRLVAFARSEGFAQHSSVVEFTHDTRIARPLRGRGLSEALAPSAAEFVPGGNDSVLAATEGTPVWWCRQGATWAHFSTCCPDELGEHEALRDQLKVGHFMGLVPLLHLLWQVCGEVDRHEQPLRASFVIDDPNLHWPSYGHLDYSDVVANANEHGYHVAFATVPLDGWLTNRRAASLVRDNPAALSLLMHGNDHVSDELGRAIHEGQAEIVLAQALRRTAAFERRSGLTVERVMVPPHEACSMTALRSMSRLGFDAACMGRRHPWREHQPLPSLPRWPLIKWHPADLIAGGLPIIPRYMVDRPREELILRALLRQPLILFGHHRDFAEGLEVLSEAANYINGLGDVRWGSVGWIARHNFLTRREGETLIVEVHSRRVTVEIPDEVGCVRVTTPNAWDDRSGRQLAYGASHAPMVQDRSGWTSGPLQVAPGTRLELTLEPDRPLDPACVSAAGFTPWSALRRALVEGRDRMQPLTEKLVGQ
jgi:hypothetical protein